VLCGRADLDQLECPCDRALEARREAGAKGGGGGGKSDDAPCGCAAWRWAGDEARARAGLAVVLAGGRGREASQGRETATSSPASPKTDRASWTGLAGSLFWLFSPSFQADLQLANSEPRVDPLRSLSTKWRRRTKREGETECYSERHRRRRPTRSDTERDRQRAREEEGALERGARAWRGKGTRMCTFAAAATSAEPSRGRG